MTTNTTAQAIEITDVKLLSGKGDGLQPNTTIRIEGERIAAIWQGVERPELAPPTQTIDGNGLVAMPGLIDAHVHMSYGEGRTAEEVDLYSGPEWIALRAAWNAKKVLHAGVTTIIDPGGNFYVGSALRDAIDAGMFQGPRIFTAGRHISADGGFADYFPSHMGLPVSAEGVLCSTQAEMLTEVRRQIKNRVDFIKLSGDAQAQEGNPNAGCCFTDEELRAVISMSHQLGRKVTVHARYSKTIRKMVELGVDWVLHASHISPDDVGFIRDSGVPLCPTMTFAQNIVDFGANCGSESGHVEFRRREMEGIIRSYQRAYAAGIPIMAGTESGFSMCPYGEWHAREIELLVTLIGLSPMQAIQAMTINNARAIGREADVGTLELGKLADLLLIDGDPLSDVRILQDSARLRLVMQGGRVIEREPIATRPRLGHERGFSVSTRRLRRNPDGTALASIV